MFRAKRLMPLAAFALAAAAPRLAAAQAPEERPLRAEDVHLDASAEAKPILPEAPAEAPPPMPHRKGVVLEGSLGALGFLGQFRHVAPTAIWLHTQLGYEALRWLMVFAEGDLAFTDSSVASEPSKVRAFPIFGFGGGVRVTAHATERVAVFVQGSLGAMKADVPTNALGVLGYRDAESLAVSYGARVGVEWYQLDRHFALGVGTGIRSASGFAKRAQSSDTPLMWDGSVALRYTF